MKSKHEERLEENPYYYEEFGYDDPDENENLDGIDWLVENEDMNRDRLIEIDILLKKLTDERNSILKDLIALDKQREDEIAKKENDLELPF